MPSRLSRADALLAGSRRYFTDVPCLHGHLAERFVSTRACVQCIGEKSANWKRNNPEKHAAQHRAWAKANPERAKALKSAEQKRNRESANKHQRKWLDANREQANAATAAWAAANPEKARARVESWTQANRGKCNARAARRRAAVLQRTPPWADQFVIDGMYELASLFRDRAGLDVEVDHVVPLQGRRVSGLHVHDNLQLVHSRANKVKSNSFPAH